MVNSKMQLDLFPKIVQNWTSKIKVFISPKIEIESSYKNKLSKINIPVYRGIITKVNHSSTKVELVSFESGENIQVETLLWIPQVKPIQLIQRLIENLGLELNEQGYIKTNEKGRTNVKGLYAAGDVKGSSPIPALAAAYGGDIAATSIVHEWYD